MKKAQKRKNIFKVLSNNKKLKYNDVVTLLVLREKGKITNPELLSEMTRMGSNLSTPESAGYCRRKLEKMNVIEGYPARINWKNVGYSSEFIILVTANSRDTVSEIKEGTTEDVKKYREQTGASIMVVNFSKKDKVILKDVLCSDKMVIVSGIATSEWAAMIFGGFYLPKRYPGINTTMLVSYENVIRDFEFQEDSFKSITPVFYDKDIDIKKQIDLFKKEFKVGGMPKYH